MPPVVFIPLSPASTWLHNELRLALRSWVKYGNIETLLIVGHKPDWLINVHHVEASDNYNKIESIFRKIKIAASLYPEFIFANDDHFLMQPLLELPYYYSCKLKDFKGSAGDTFYRYVDQTYRLFPNGNFYDIHTPMICKSEVIDKMEHKRDILFKSYYCNTVGVEGVELHDCKIGSHIRTDEIERYVRDRPFISTGESISVDLKKFLFEKFSEKSIFEM